MTRGRGRPGPPAPRHLEARRPTPTSTPSRRSASAARPCRPSARSRRFAVRSCRATARGTGHAGARRGGRDRREAARGRRRAGHHRRGAGPLLQHAGAAQVPQERADRAGRRAPAAARASRSPSPDRALPRHPQRQGRPRRRRARATLRDRLGALLGLRDAPGACSTSTARREASRVSGPGRAAAARARQSRRDHRSSSTAAPCATRALTQALIEAYRPLLAARPVPGGGARASSCRCREVDVNVHPTKAWVRFRSPRLVQEARVPRRAGGAPLEPRRPAPAGLGAGGDGRRGPARQWPGVAAAERPAMSGWRGRRRMRCPRRAVPRGAPAPFGRGRFGAVIGQLQDTFIVAASDDEVFFIDQHVAHERVLFERLRARASTRARSPSQELLVPAAARARRRARPTLLARVDADARAAWASPSRASAAPRVLLRAVPALLKGEEPRRLDRGRSLDEVGAPAPGRDGAARPPRALLRRLPRRHQGPRAARSARRWRGSSRDLAADRDARTSARTAGPSSSRLSLTRDQAGAGAHVVSRAAAARHRAGRPGWARPPSPSASPARLRDRGRQRRLAPGLSRHGHRHRQADRRRARGACRHHLLDVVDPDERYHAARFRARGARRDRGHPRARAAARGRRRHRPLRPRAPEGARPGAARRPGLRARARGDAPRRAGCAALHARLAALDSGGGAARSTPTTGSASSARSRSARRRRGQRPAADAAADWARAVTRWRLVMIGLRRERGGAQPEPRGSRARRCSPVG